MTTQEENKKAIIARIRRAKGQMTAIENMVAADDDCKKIAQQMRAVRSAMDSAYFELMNCAIERAVGESIENDEHWPTVLADLTKTLAKYA